MYHTPYLKSKCRDGLWGGEGDVPCKIEGGIPSLENQGDAPPLKKLGAQEERAGTFQPFNFVFKKRLKKCVCSLARYHFFTQLIQILPTHLTPSSPKLLMVLT